jgi:hypothetical protein
MPPKKCLCGRVFQNGRAFSAHTQRHACPAFQLNRAKALQNAAAALERSNNLSRPHQDTEYPQATEDITVQQQPGPLTSDDVAPAVASTSTVSSIDNISLC